MSASARPQTLPGFAGPGENGARLFHLAYERYIATEARRLRRLYALSLVAAALGGLAGMGLLLHHTPPPPLPYSPPPAAIAIDLAPEPARIQAPPLEKPPGPPPVPEPPAKPPEIMAPPSPVPIPPVAVPEKIRSAPLHRKPREAHPVIRPTPPGVPTQATSDTAPPPSDAPPSTVSAQAAKGPPSRRDASESPASWQGAVLARLERVKRYPAEAQSDRQEGTALLRFSMDRNGHVLSAGLVRKTGYTLLDEETLALVRRAEPLPAPPDTIRGTILTLTVPIEFFMNER